MVTELLGHFLQLDIVLVSDDVGQGLLPGAELRLLQLLFGHMLDDASEIVLHDGLHNLLDENILVAGEVLFLDLLIQLFATCFSNEKSLCGATAFESYLSSAFKLTQKKILLNDTFCTLVPIGIPRDGLLHEVLPRVWCPRPTAPIVVSSASRPSWMHV